MRQSAASRVLDYRVYERSVPTLERDPRAMLVVQVRQLGESRDVAKDAYAVEATVRFHLPFESPLLVVDSTHFWRFN